MFIVFLTLKAKNSGRDSNELLPLTLAVSGYQYSLNRVQFKNMNPLPDDRIEQKGQTHVGCTFLTNLDRHSR